VDGLPWPLGLVVLPCALGLSVAAPVRLLSLRCLNGTPHSPSRGGRVEANCLVFYRIAWCLSFGIVVKAIMAWNARQNGDAEAGHVPHHHGEKTRCTVFDWILMVFYDLDPKLHGASYPAPPGGANIYEANPSSSDIYYAQPDSPAPAHGMRMPSSGKYREK